MFLRHINDIRITNKTISVIRNVSLTVKEIESQIQSVVYTPSKDSKSNDTENAKLPPFIQVFYFLFFSYLKIPTEELLWSNYVSWIGGEIESEFITFNGKQFSAEGVRGRLNRTYPSLIRDLHFLYLLEYSRQFEVVEYSMKQDYYNGLDLKVERSGKKVFVSLFVDTSRARFFKGKKSIRHDYSEVEEIVFNVQFDSLTLVGSVYLLNNSHVELLVNLIDQYVLSKS